MPGFIQLRTIPVAIAGAPFDCTVFITGGRPGDIVTIRLAQTAGMHPLYSARADVPIGFDGGGVHVFTGVTLAGAGSEARLVADDIASAIPLAPGDAHVSVIAAPVHMEVLP